MPRGSTKAWLEKRRQKEGGEGARNGDNTREAAAADREARRRAVDDKDDDDAFTAVRAAVSRSGGAPPGAWNTHPLNSRRLSTRRLCVCVLSQRGRWRCDPDCVRVIETPMCERGRSERSVGAVEVGLEEGERPGGVLLLNSKGEWEGSLHV